MSKINLPKIIEQYPREFKDVLEKFLHAFDVVKVDRDKLLRLFREQFPRSFSDLDVRDEYVEVKE